MSGLVDPQGRRIRKLRISLTESCNLHCFHCHREDALAAAPADWLSPEEIAAIVARLAAQGVDQVRLTGGEPTLRPDLHEIVARLGRLSLRRLGITSNGLLLGPLLPALQAAGLHNLNLSLDSLDPVRFERITGAGEQGRVLETLAQARELGLEVKLNVVLFRGINDDEALAFVELAERRGIVVRFLELMRIGPDHEQNRRYYVPAAETLARIRQAGVRLRALRRPTGATAFEYRTGGGGRIGFIASESRPFCATCSRLRLSAAGVLRSCLMREDGLSVRGLAAAEWPEAVARVLSWKPVLRPGHVDQPMVRIGG